MPWREPDHRGRYVKWRATDDDVGVEPCIRLRGFRKVSDQRDVDLDPRGGQPQEKKRAAVDPALVATGSFADQRTQTRSFYPVRELEAAIEPQRELVSRLSNGRLSEWINNGHFMFAEDPDRFGQEVNAFLGGR